MIAQLDREYVRTRPRKAVARLLSYALFEGRPVTTRGQWINPFVFAQFDVLKCVPQLKPVRRPIFIVGTGRSGTTLLGKILSLHREVGFLNEPKALWHAVYPHEDVIGSYDRGPAAYRLGAADASDEVRRKAYRLLGAYLALTGASRVVDKYPEMVFRIPFVRSIFPDARFILLVRNGWDTLRSIDAWSDRLGEDVGDERHDWWGVDDRKWRLLVNQVATSNDRLRRRRDELLAMDRHADRAALEWALSMKEGLRHRRRLPEAVTLVRYEDLLEAPRETTDALLAECDLSPDASPAAYSESTVRSPGSKDPFVLHDAVKPVFRAAMEQLGYTS